MSAYKSIDRMHFFVGTADYESRCAYLISNMASESWYSWVMLENTVRYFKLFTSYEFLVSRNEQFCAVGIPSILDPSLHRGCFVAEPQRKSTTSRWRRMLATVINTPTSWCSAMPANCSGTTNGLFTTNWANILSRGRETSASWSIGRLNKLLTETLC